MRARVLALPFILLASCAHAQKRGDTAVVARDRIERSLSFGHSNVVYVIDPITVEDAAGRRHWALRYEAGRVVEAREISPLGDTWRRSEFAYAGGTLTVRDFDAFNVLVGTRVTDASGHETFTARSGVVGEFGCHHRKVVVDAKGRTADISCFDRENRPTPDNLGCERRAFERNDRGHPVAARCLRADGTPAAYSSGEEQTRVVSQDSLGYELVIDYLQADGTPKKVGCARATQEFNGAGILVRRSCTDRLGKFDVEARWTYDERGCRTSMQYVDELGSASLRGGISKYLYAPDRRCADLRVETRGVLGQLVGRPAVKIFERDESGQVIVARCLDELQAPRSCTGVTDDDRFGSTVRYEYDERGRLASHRCFTEDDAPSRCSFSYPHGERDRYDASGEMAGQDFFDEKGKPALAMGAARIVLERDVSGALVATRYFGKNGEPVLAALGCHEMRTTYDDHHRMVSMECRDVDGTPHTTNACKGSVCFAAGASRITVVRITEGKLENVHTDPAGKELARIDCDEKPCLR